MKQNGRTENDVSAAPYVWEESVQDANLMIVLSSDEEEDESDQNGELSPETSAVSSASYDVEYRALD